MVWNEYFREHNPAPVAMRRHILKLHEERKFEDVIAFIQGALINGKSQPWMYEVLAVTMQAAGRPAREVDRVLLSSVDFTALDVPSMLFSAAYLARFQSNDRALALYRQASKLDPLRPEPYVLGLRLAREAKDVDALQWAACGIMTQAWTQDHESLQQEALRAAAEGEALLMRAGDSARLAAFREAIAMAKIRDLILELKWSGDGDLDLIIEEPLGTICSFETPYSRGGGVLVHDGYGPKQENTYETYVCPMGAAGEYRVKVRHAGGQIVAKQATLTITRYAGTDHELVRKRAVKISAEDKVIKISLHQGRREDLAPPTSQTTQIVPPHLTSVGSSNRGSLLQQLSGTSVRSQSAQARFNNSRLRQNAMAPFQRAGVGYQPIVGVIPEGSMLNAQAVISGDRRYVRLSLSPVFSTITDVFTFSFANSGGNATGGGQNPSN